MFWRRVRIFTYVVIVKLYYVFRMLDHIQRVLLIIPLVYHCTLSNISCKHIDFVHILEVENNLIGTFDSASVRLRHCSTRRVWHSEEWSVLEAPVELTSETSWLNWFWWMVVLKDTEEDAERCTLTSSSVTDQLRPAYDSLSVLDPWGGQSQAGISHWTPAFAVSQVHLSDFCVPLLSLIA